MKKALKTGFIPLSWESWDGNRHTGRLAEKMRDRCLASVNAVGTAEIIVPPKTLTEGGLVGSLENASKSADALALFCGFSGIRVVRAR